MRKLEKSENNTMDEWLYEPGDLVIYKHKVGGCEEEGDRVALVVKRMTNLWEGNKGRKSHVYKIRWLRECKRRVFESIILGSGLLPYM
jgi:hypothetical protein